jgi:serine kinase of HPr protein (carbohydrate metabolism regulator)
MSTTPVNIHATAVIVGKTGLLFLGPSGWGKSMLAFACITEAQRAGLDAAAGGRRPGHDLDAG